MLRADWVALSITPHVARAIYASDTPAEIYSKSGRKRFLREYIFEVEFLLFKSVDEVGVWKRAVFFAVQFIFQFGVLHTKCGHMAVVHLILLVVRLDDLTSRVNHENFVLSSPKLDQIELMGRAPVFWR